MVINGMKKLTCYIRSLGNKDLQELEDRNLIKRHRAHDETSKVGRADSKCKLLIDNEEIIMSDHILV